MYVLGLCKQDMDMNTTCGSDALEEVMEAEEQQESAETALEEGTEMETACPPASPAQTREMDVPAFCLMYSTA